MICACGMVTKASIKIANLNNLERQRSVVRYEVNRNKLCTKENILLDFIIYSTITNAYRSAVSLPQAVVNLSLRNSCGR